MKCRLASVAMLAFGIFAILMMGGDPNPALLKIEILVFSAAALAYGFNVLNPPAWLQSKAIRGAICMYMGVGAIFVPANFILASFLMGAGIKFMMAEFNEPPPPPPPATIKPQKGEIVVRPKNEVTL